MARLDTRLCLYGEKRLTDPKVRALRGAAEGDGLSYASMGWAAKDGAVTQQTVVALRKAYLVDVIAERVVATSRGHEVLRRIDRTPPATSTARSAE